MFKRERHQKPVEEMRELPIDLDDFIKPYVTPAERLPSRQRAVRAARAAAK
jgi:hypothetical protein